MGGHCNKKPTPEQAGKGAVPLKHALAVLGDF
jgi:hypothetical protein